MTQEGGLHGPRKDDALKRETRGEIQANRATRIEEWREPEPPGEDQPDATWAPTDPADRIGSGSSQPGGAEPALDPRAIELRSDLARYLDRTAFPADREQLIATLAGHHAPGALLDVAATLPAGTTFARFADVLRALGLPPETRPG